jgi:hypothetical protein
MNILNKILIVSFVAVGFFGFSSVVKAVCPWVGDPVQCSATQDLSSGAKCNRVCDLQEKLYSNDYSITNKDGIYGPETIAAVKKYQEEHGLDADGIAGVKTLTSLGLVSPATTDPGVNPPGGGSSGGSTGSKFCDTTKDFVFENGLCIPKNKFAANSLANSTSLTDLIAKVLKILLTFAGVAVVVAMVYGGYLYIMAAGNDEMAEKGKNALINSTIGLVIILLAYALVNILVTLVTK